MKDFENRIEWNIGEDDCYLDSKFFNIYFSENGINNFKNIGSTSNDYFIHKNLSNLKGAYFITALDRSGNESVPTDTIRRDNCPKYLLPNAFSPNDDGKNDFFTPFFTDGSILNFNYGNCPRFVKSVKMSIVDRTGKEVFSHDSEINVLDGIYITIIGGLGMIVPSQGGIGSYHLAVKLGLNGIGIAMQPALLFAFAVHTAQTLMTILFGLFSSFILLSTKKNVEKTK